MKTVVIDYGSGNLRSAAKALERAGRETGLGGSVTVTGDAADLDSADRIVLPGVGAFGDCTAGLQSLPGMVDALERNVREKKKPFLGICVGMQLMADRGIEHGQHDGLGWIPGEVRPLSPADKALKIPHMGWNQVHWTDSHFLTRGIPSGSYFYFVHSYFVDTSSPKIIASSTKYIQEFTSAVSQDNVFATQFHPEKSAKNGLTFLTNFVKWDASSANQTD